MKVSGTRLWEIIPANGFNFRGFILSLYFTHISFKLTDSRAALLHKLFSRYSLKCVLFDHCEYRYIYTIVDTMATEDVEKGCCHSREEAMKKYEQYIVARLNSMCK